MPYANCYYCPKTARPQLVYGPVDLINGVYVYACDTHRKDKTAKEERTDVAAEKKAANAKPVIAKVSDKRKKQDYQYNKIRKKLLKENPICKAALLGCTKIATDIHHTEGRVGDNYLDEAKMLPVCRSCHVFCENHPEIAKEKGLSASRLKVSEK